MTTATAIVAPKGCGWRQRIRAACKKPPNCTGICSNARSYGVGVVTPFSVGVRVRYGDDGKVRVGNNDGYTIAHIMLSQKRKMEFGQASCWNYTSNKRN
jgi:hypothetical protein